MGGPLVFLEQSRLSLEDQNEMSLLTALTEILDNADSENLSPFDTIPDSELLVSPRESSSVSMASGRDTGLVRRFQPRPGASTYSCAQTDRGLSSSQLHKLLNLSRTPPERDLITPIDPLGPSTGSSRVSGVSDLGPF